MSFRMGTNSNSSFQLYPASVGALHIEKPLLQEVETILEDVFHLQPSQLIRRVLEVGPMESLHPLPALHLD